MLSHSRSATALRLFDSNQGQLTFIAMSPSTPPRLKGDPLATGERGLVSFLVPTPSEPGSFVFGPP
jgi:hypothetical protein